MSPVDPVEDGHLAAFRERRPTTTPLRIGAGRLSIGSVGRDADAERPAALYRAYLDVVREVRGTRFDDVVHLRRADLEVLAAHLGVDLHAVIDGVGDALGANARQKRTIMALFVAGATVVAFAASLWNEVGASGSWADRPTVEIVATTAPGVDRPTTTTTTDHAVDEAVVGAVAEVAEVDAGVVDDADEPDLAATATSTTDAPATTTTAPASTSTTTTSTTTSTTTPTTTATSATSATAPTAASSAPSPTSAPGTPPEQGTLDDGTRVAVGTPPVPTTSVPVGTVPGPDGPAQVAVGTPPVPPSD